MANTVPAGEAAALGMSWTMLSSWGIGTGEYVRYTLVSGIFNVLAKLTLPVVALAILALTGEPTAGLAAGAVAGPVLLLCGGAGLFVVLRGDPRHARHLVRALEWLVGVACRLARRPRPGPIGPALTDFRRDTRDLLAARGKRIALATAATHLSLALVLITCLYAGGVTQAQVSWQTALAAFALVRLLSALPVTPGGIGVVELALTSMLCAGLDGPTAAKATAAVLLFRTITYLLPIPLGAAAYLTWQNNTSWRMTPQLRTALGRRH